METYITESIKKDALSAISHLISIPSILETSTSNAPFGQNIKNALDYILELSKSLGFTTYVDPDGYYGFAEIGTGKELIGILCHLDVVPVGDSEKWRTDPFQLVQEGDHLYGRGIQDDKGPTIASIYAVYALHKQGIQFNKRVRLIFGTDEETLWRCMEKYNEKEEKATIGFAPDSSFPLVYAEKGLLQVKLHGKGTSSLHLKAGQAFNVVPGKASYDGQDYLDFVQDVKELGYNYDLKSDQITVLGKSVHSKDSKDGINAIVQLINILSKTYQLECFDFIRDEIGFDTTASEVFGDISDEVSGELSVNIAMLEINSEKTEICLDLRLPVLCDKEKVVKNLIECADKYRLNYEEFDYLPSLYVPKDSHLVQILLSVYRKYTGDLTEPLTTGGATFARTMDNCVAFGACFPWTEQTEHQENECMPLQDFYKVMEIYAEAISCLLEIE